MITQAPVLTPQSKDDVEPTRSPGIVNDDTVADLSPLFDDTSADWPTSLEAVDRVELIRLQQLDSDLLSVRSREQTKTSVSATFRCARESLERRDVSSRSVLPPDRCAYSSACQVATHRT